MGGPIAEEVGAVSGRGLFVTLRGTRVAPPVPCPAFRRAFEGCVKSRSRYRNDNCYFTDRGLSFDALKPTTLEPPTTLEHATLDPVANI